jgi:hypothetical protein
VSCGDGASQEGGGERGETHVDSRSAVVERGRCGEGDGDVEEQKRVWEGMEVGKRKRKLRLGLCFCCCRGRSLGDDETTTQTEEGAEREAAALQTPDPKSSCKTK